MEAALSSRRAVDHCQRAGCGRPVSLLGFLSHPATVRAWVESGFCETCCLVLLQRSRALGEAGIEGGGGGEASGAGGDEEDDEEDYEDVEYSDDEGGGDDEYDDCDDADDDSEAREETEVR
jgi:hypothetical protein